MDATTSAYLSITSDSSLDFARIGELLCMSATETWSPTSGESKPRKWNWGWRVQSDLPREADPEQQVEHLVTLIEACAGELARYVREAPVKATIEVVLYQNDDGNPQLFLEPELVQRVARLGVALWLDIYP